jgi:hypothetical protein
MAEPTHDAENTVTVYLAEYNSLREEQLKRFDSQLDFIHPCRPVAADTPPSGRL